MSEFDTTSIPVAETGIVPVSTVVQDDDLPTDLASPRGSTFGDWVGIVVGAVLLAATGALLIFAATMP